jgi:hypothetical protein
MDNSQDSPLRRWINILVNVAAFASLGVGLTGWIKPLLGVGFMAFGATYFIWELVNDPAVKRKIPAEFRLLLGVILGVVVIGVSFPRIQDKLSQKTLEPIAPKTSPEQTNTNPNKAPNESGGAKAPNTELGETGINKSKSKPRTQKPSQSMPQGMDQTNVTMSAYLAPGSYPEGILIGGIIWNKNYIDVRLDVAVGHKPVRDLDVSVALDTSVAGMGQLSQFPGVVAFPAGNPPAAWLMGEDSAFPITPSPGLMRLAPSYKLQCSQLYHDTVLHLIIASMALNPLTPKGEFPQQVFAPPRPPKVMHLKGTYKDESGNIFTIAYNTAFAAQN